MKIPEFHSNIHQFLMYDKNSATPDASKCKDMIAYLQSHTGLTEKQCSILISGLFAEIIGNLLKNKNISADELGNLFLTKNNIICFKPSKRLKLKLK